MPLVLAFGFGGLEVIKSKSLFLFWLKKNHSLALALRVLLFAIFGILKLTHLV